MTEEQQPKDKPEPPKGFVNKRREKIVAEIERNRRGEYKVPTWVLAACLVALLAGLAAIVIWG